FAFGLVRRSRRAMLQAMRDRTERLEIERDQQARIATAAERARIAREMHDIVAHSLSVMIAQADGGRYAAAADPAAAQRALGTIAETGRAALADMRRLLGVLREDEPAPATPLGLVAPDGAAGGTRPARDAVPAGTAAASSGAAPAAPAGAGATAAAAAPLRPQPDAADIGHLVEQAKDGGMRVSWARVGVERRLPPGVGLTLYRVCQEALTNVRKHAGPRPAVTVLVRWGEDEVELRVDDDGRGLAADAAGPDEPAPSPGYGLLGMRERAEMFGGTLSAGPRQGGGFSVRFVVPIPRAAAPAAVPDPVPAGAVEAEGGVGSGPTGAAGSPTDSGPERAPEPDSPTEPDSGPGADADDADSPGPTDLQDTRGAR
ncbi:MAG TPA: histidine kinase, partial [Promicromonospora sp.]|nr:histidine kinase [Promicromonospora sp.]